MRNVVPQSFMMLAVLVLTRVGLNPGPRTGATMSTATPI
ncbi:uncharacterized protein METZ01_LOCUS101468 [marine metagenome]|uniref:Uncharacterized protein n=1 Tax=marine metagenome TaxID=408172 RepID=A0A381W7X3_9ZZZZ